MTFRTRLWLEPLSGRRWRVVRALEYRSTYLRRSITVPCGFVCDLNSVPRFLWWASTPADYPEAGVIHDWGYAGNLTRLDADNVYYEVLADLRMPRLRRAMRYYALRAFGWWAYKGEV